VECIVIARVADEVAGRGSASTTVSKTAENTTLIEY